MFMPVKTGKEAYSDMKKLRPDIKAIFLSGYSEDLLTEDNVLGNEVAFIYKPVSPEDLLHKVRETLDK